MDCETCFEALTAHALGRPLAGRARDHLEGCAACRVRLEDARRAARDMDDELRRALALQPSPGFVARIREGAAAAGDTPRWRRWWPALVAGAAGAAVLMTVQLARREPARPGLLDPLRQAATRPHTLLPRSQPPVAPLTSSRPSGQLSNARPAATRRPGEPSREPEVIIPPGQRQAIRRFAASLNAGLISIPPMLAQSGEPLALIEIAPLELKPIVIPPVEVPGWQGPGDSRRRDGP